MDIFERVWKLLYKWKCENRGNDPDRIFLGFEEIVEAKSHNEFLNFIVNPNEYQMFGISVEPISKTNYLSVGNILTEAKE